jgi:cyclopropane fatty-acyl-phospholipid synthase-like methyltransferase
MAADPHDESLALDARPGDAHYRAYVGPPRDYDLIAAMGFGLLVVLGLRQHHRVLDIGCGSLRIGRLLIAYLNRGGYAGLEPHRWLVEEGIRREVGEDQVRIKAPTFVFDDNGASLFERGARFDFLLAQSIFSHTGPDLLDRWLADAARLLDDTGALAATYLEGEQDPAESGWIYPGCVLYRRDTMASMAARHGLQFVPLDWHHPRQRWALFAKPGFDADWFRDRALSWNACFARLDARRQEAAG